MIYLFDNIVIRKPYFITFCKSIQNLCHMMTLVLSYDDTSLYHNSYDDTSFIINLIWQLAIDR